MFIKYYVKTILHMKSGKILEFDTDYGSSKEQCTIVGNAMLKNYKDYCFEPDSKGYLNFGTRYFNIRDIEGVECFLGRKFLGIKLP